jgi:hypothetical protein
MAMMQRRCRVEPPDLAIAELDFANEVSDPDYRLDHVQHFLCEPVTLGRYLLVFGLQTAIRFKRLQSLDPFDELCRSFAQAISMKHGVVHLAASELHIVSGQLRIPRSLPRRLRCSFRSGRRCLDLGEQTSHIGGLRVLREGRRDPRVQTVSRLGRQRLPPATTPTP